MNKKAGLMVAGVAALGFATAAFAAAPQPVRVHGTIEGVSGDTLGLKSNDGGTVDLALNNDTRFTAVVPASLSDIKKGDFVGIGATGPEDHLVAVEVHIFPQSMRGTGEGHHPWQLPATVSAADHHTGPAASGAPGVHGSMTNGTVSGSAAAPGARGSMTNGVVSGSTGVKGARTLAVADGNGNTVKILVKPGTPIVRLVPAERSVLTPGAKAFAVASQDTASGPPTAKVVNVGKNGLMPPM